MTRGIKPWAWLPRIVSTQRISRAAAALNSNSTSNHSRWFRTTSPRATDGVFRGLTDNRLPTPWIEAFKMQQEGKSTSTSEGEARHQSGSQERHLSPRRMSDSYHRVVLPLGQDPWLSDTYLNSSGHIRLGTMFMDLDALSVSGLKTPPVGMVSCWLTTREGYYCV